MPSLVWAACREPSRAGQGGGTLGDQALCSDTPRRWGPPASPVCLGLGAGSCQLSCPQRPPCAPTQEARANLQRPRQFPVCAGYFWKWLSDLFLSQAPGQKELTRTPTPPSERALQGLGAVCLEGLGLAERHPPGHGNEPDARKEESPGVVLGTPHGHRAVAWGGGGLSQPLGFLVSAIRTAAYDTGPACQELHPKAPAKAKLCPRATGGGAANPSSAHPDSGV